MVGQRRRVRDEAWRKVRTSSCLALESMVQRLDIISKAIQNHGRTFKSLHELHDLKCFDFPLGKYAHCHLKNLWSKPILGTQLTNP